MNSGKKQELELIHGLQNWIYFCRKGKTLWRHIHELELRKFSASDKHTCTTRLTNITFTNLFYIDASTSQIPENKHYIIQVLNRANSCLHVLFKSEPYKSWTSLNTIEFQRERERERRQQQEGEREEAVAGGFEMMEKEQRGKGRFSSSNDLEFGDGEGAAPQRGRGK